MDTIELNGLTFRVETPYDNDHGLPWEEYDGHGPVREVSYGYFGRPEKLAGERVLKAERGAAYLYDFREATRIAKRDGWGLSDKARAELTRKLGREPTRSEATAAAVEADFDHLRRYLNDGWTYVGVVVTLLDIDGAPAGHSESLWGIESDAGDYLDEVAQELAEQIASEIGDRREIEHVTRARREWVVIREAA